MEERLLDPDMVSRLLFRHHLRRRAQRGERQEGRCKLLRSHRQTLNETNAKKLVRRRSGCIGVWTKVGTLVLEVRRDDALQQHRVQESEEKVNTGKCLGALATGKAAEGHKSPSPSSSKSSLAPKRHAAGYSGLPGRPIPRAHPPRVATQAGLLVQRGASVQVAPAGCCGPRHPRLRARDAADRRASSAARRASAVAFGDAARHSVNSYCCLPIL
ncbi:hypothetical protein HPB51_001193 [Rhipicephalus microplus]|uniref:Uncharacterized protein n=1 Tax=Rhipicephalus microplus TaxID=6941 RepID=A0A9J6DRP6_RHIMP|nr:hypothetical protein HPB51_001193 [Rhipicephalus microplus]